jgi:hypothetical protein
MVKAKANGKESAKKASKPGKKEPKRLDKTDESTDIPAIPSTSEWKGRKITKVCAHLIQSTLMKFIFCLGLNFISHLFVFCQESNYLIVFTRESLLL